MILIGDSGSTKTDWRLIEASNISALQSQGLNPNICSDNDIKNAILSLSLDFNSITKVYFFGAGCGSTLNQNRMKELFSFIFSN